ncbi:putative ATP/GTP-binding protein [Streptococcus mitis]|uniref:Putative ATP/GTP-binding protein n=1 Tax=Streptococcus mitis TaxID=28037 RepID=A0A081QJA4_STRMT|nr:ATP-binding protein [Streptococcus mitis]KEQ43027.1 putative ATP/GTP-binding protein [Streptococcus mitis]
MNRLESLRIKNYKHIGDSYIGFDKLENLNILVGQNNIGKSTLLQSIEMLISEDVTNRELSTDTMLEFGFCPTETEIKNVFREDTSGGEIGINHFTFGAKYINEYISFEYQPIKAIGKEQITLSNIPGIPQTQITSYKRIDNFNYLANNYLNNNIRRLKLIKLSADRNLVPEIQNSNRTVSEDGTGATNLLRQYLNVANLPNEVVENDILNALNQIMKPETHFERIMCQEIETTDGPNSKWEVQLVNENGKIPISNSGSGLKTILLVLIKLFLETRETTNYNFEPLLTNTVFIFEELENNLHPAIQRNLFEFLYQWAKENNSQIFLTTHSTVPINMFSGRDNVTLTHIKKENNQIITNSALSFIENEYILMSLGVRASDILQSNAVIWVEGPSDRIYINKWIELYSKGTLKENIHYQILFYGGRLLSHLTGKVDESNELIQLFRANLHSIIVIDSDKTDSKKRINQTKLRIKKEFMQNQAIVWITQGKEIENYLSRNIFNKVYKVNKQIGQYEKIDDFLNENSRKKNIGKYYVTNKASESISIAKEMTREDINILDLETQISTIVKQIKIWNGIQ